MKGCIPDPFKSAVVTPLIKKPNLPSDHLKNYRPVSGLSFISKLVECVVAKQLLEHIHVHKLDNPYQSAYKAGHSTKIALLSIKNEVHLSLSRGEPTALVLFDLSAAFDTIDHSTLLSCLRIWFGVGGSVLKWFTSYLTDRYQSIKLGSTLSDVCKLLFGIPQGSVLGPLLVSLYTTPLSLIVRKHKGIKFQFYADDNQVYVHLSQKNESAAFEKLNRCLDDVKEWMSTSKLKLNPDKTKFIIFGSKRQRDKLKACFPIDILGSPLCPVDSVKNLGVWFDSDFSLAKHVQNVCKSCFVKLGDFRHVRQFLTHDVSVLVANALVSSRLDYCNSLFRSLSKFNLCIQISAARIVSNTSRYTSITHVLKKLHWLPVEERTVFKTATLVCKFLHTGFTKHFAPYLPTAVLIVPGAAKVLTISLSFQTSTLLFINLSNSLVIVLLLMLSLCGMLFQMRFVPLPPWPLSESSLKPTCTPKHTHLSLDHPLAFSVVLDPLFCLWILKFCRLLFGFVVP